MSDHPLCYFFGFIAAGITCVITILVTLGVRDSKWENDVVARGHGIYVVKTNDLKQTFAEFEFLPSGDNKIGGVEK